MGPEPDSHGNVSYTIDDTVVLEGDDRAYHVWDLDIDPSKEDSYALSAISRDGVPIRSYLLPDEEVRFFTGGDEVWWEHRGEPAVKLDEEFTVSERDPDPYVHHGDYALVLAADDPECDTARVTLKLRETKDT